MEEKGRRGGARPGAGRKTGYRKPGGTRKGRGLNAYDDEWELILEFSHIVKKIGVTSAREKFGMQQKDRGNMLPQS